MTVRSVRGVCTTTVFGAIIFIIWLILGFFMLWKGFHEVLGGDVFMGLIEFLFGLFLIIILYMVVVRR